MAKKTISQSLKDLFLGLGGDASALADNTSASDYIQDLESAIKASASGAAEDLIDDEEASTTKTYSSSKIESLIPENELPTPAVGDIGKVVSVVSDGESGAEYALETPSSGGDFPPVKFTATSRMGAPFTFTFPEGYDRSSFFVGNCLALKVPTMLELAYLQTSPSVLALNGNLFLTSFGERFTYRGVLLDANYEPYDVIFSFVRVPNPSGSASTNDIFIANKITTT